MLEKILFICYYIKDNAKNRRKYAYTNTTKFFIQGVFRSSAYRKKYKQSEFAQNERASLQLAFMSDVDCKVSVEVQCGFKDMLEVYLVEELYSSMPIAKGRRAIF